MFSLGFYSSISIDSKLYRSLFLHRFKTLKLLVISEFWQCLQSNKCSNIALFLSVPLWSEIRRNIWREVSLYRRCSDQQNKYTYKWHCVKCFRTFSFVVEVVGYFFASVCRFNCYIMLLEN